MTSILILVAAIILQTSNSTATPSPVSGVPIPPNPTSWIVTFGAYATLVAAILGAGYGVWRFIKSVKDNAKKAKEAEETEIQKRITTAVDEAKNDAAKKLELAKQLADHWEQLATIYERERNHERETRENELKDHALEKERLRAAKQEALDALDQAKLKIEQIVDLNLGLQGKVNENSDLIGKLQEELKKLQEKIDELNRKH